LELDEDREVACDGANGVFEFQLRSDRGLRLVTADRSLGSMAPAVLDVFLTQLAGGA